MLPASALRRFALFGAVAAAAVAAGLYIGLSGRGAPIDPDAARALAAVEFRDLKNAPVSIGGALRGQVVVVNFWATWCTPCRAEVPDLVRTQSRFAERGVRVVGIAMYDTPEKVKRFAEEFGVNYPLVLAGDDVVRLVSRLGNPRGGIPHTLIFDRSGAVAAVHLGALDADKLAAMITPLL